MTLHGDLSPSGIMTICGTTLSLKCLNSNGASASAAASRNVEAISMALDGGVMAAMFWTGARSSGTTNPFDPLSATASALRYISKFSIEGWKNPGCSGLRPRISDQCRKSSICEGESLSNEGSATSGSCATAVSGTVCGGLRRAPSGSGGVYL